MARPRRSALYMPGSNARALEKARSLPADVLLLDLEDAVAPAEKVAARALVMAEIAKGGFAPREVVLRVNGADTPWGEADLAAAAKASGTLDAVLLPKVESAAMLDEAAAKLDAAGAPAGLALWAMMETPRGIVAANEIAAHPRLSVLVMGTNDLVTDMQAEFRADRMPVIGALTACVLAARVHDRVVLDGVYNAFRDAEGLQEECEQGRSLGMDGKTLIHPAQLATANRVFAPSADAVALAQRQLAAYEAAAESGEGVAVLDGKIVENLHAAAARRLLARANAIAALEAAIETPMAAGSVA
ncbi:MAG: CoA ester lyase [Pseudomonadota bacterium]